MSQIGRNLTDAVDGILNGKRYLIHDRDPLFTAEFLSMLAEVGVESVKLPPRSPNLKDYASHCTSLARFDMTDTNRWRLFNFPFLPLHFLWRLRAGVVV
jgi:putative transposase